MNGFNEVSQIIYFFGEVENNEVSEAHEFSAVGEVNQIG